MKLVRWSFMGLYMPMMEDEKGDLYCTTKQLTGALGTSVDALYMLISRHPEDFDLRNLTECQAKDFLRVNKVEFGISRVTNRMHLWSEDDMVSAAILTKSSTSRAFRKNLSRFIKENARRDVVSISTLEAVKAQHEAEFTELRGKMEAFQHVIDQFIPASDRAASAAGQMLQARQHALRVIEGGMH